MLKLNYRLFITTITILLSINVYAIAHDTLQMVKETPINQAIGNPISKVEIGFFTDSDWCDYDAVHYDQSLGHEIDPCMAHMGSFKLKNISSSRFESISRTGTLGGIEKNFHQITKEDGLFVFTEVQDWMPDRISSTWYKKEGTNILHWIKEYVGKGNYGSKILNTHKLVKCNCYY